MACTQWGVCSCPKRLLKKVSLCNCGNSQCDHKEARGALATHITLVYRARRVSSYCEILPTVRVQTHGCPRPPHLLTCSFLAKHHSEGNIGLYSSHNLAYDLNSVYPKWHSRLMQNQNLAMKSHNDKVLSTVLENIALAQ